MEVPATRKEVVNPLPMIAPAALVEMEEIYPEGYHLNKGESAEVKMMVNVERSR